MQGITKIHENIASRKFGAIRYTIHMYNTRDIIITWVLFDAFLNDFSNVLQWRSILFQHVVAEGTVVGQICRRNKITSVITCVHQMPITNINNVQDCVSNYFLFWSKFSVNHKKPTKAKNWSVWGSNSWPWRYQHHALPTELTDQLWIKSACSC